MISEKIVQVAKSYKGQTEILGNKGFTDPVFLKKMKDAGWQLGNAWCTLLTEIIWKDAYGKENKLWAVIDKLFSASALATYYNFAHSTLFSVGQVPVPGAVVIWKHGIDPNGWQGHAGVVTAKIPEGFTSVEGNTSGTDPNIREGYITAEKPHQVGLPPRAGKLNIVGFIYPAE